MNSKWIVTLRQSGRSIVLTVPGPILEILKLSPGSVVALDISNGELVASRDQDEDSTLMETPELLSLLAQVHAATSRTSKAVTRTLEEIAEEDRKAVNRRAAIAAQARSELGEGGARLIVAMLGSRATQITS